MIVKIKSSVTGNCKCRNCGKYQEGMKSQPFTVWFKADDEKRGHNSPVCSMKCAREYAETIKRGETK